MRETKYPLVEAAEDQRLIFLGSILMKKNLTVNETATELNCSRVTVYSMLNKGELYGFKVGGATRIPMEAIEQLKKANPYRPESAI